MAALLLLLSGIVAGIVAGRRWPRLGRASELAALLGFGGVGLWLAVQVPTGFAGWGWYVPSGSGPVWTGMLDRFLAAVALALPFLGVLPRHISWSLGDPEHPQLSVGERAEIARPHENCRSGASSP